MRAQEHQSWQQKKEKKTLKKVKPSWSPGHLRHARCHWEPERHSSHSKPISGRDKRGINSQFVRKLIHFSSEWHPAPYYCWVRGHSYLRSPDTNGSGREKLILAFSLRARSHLRSLEMTSLCEFRPSSQPNTTCSLHKLIFRAFVSHSKLVFKMASWRRVGKPGFTFI